MQAIAMVLAGLGAAALLGASVLTLLDVALRYWGISILSLSEFVLLLVTASVAAFFPLSLQENRQLAIRYLGKALGNPWEWALNVFGALATFVFFGIIAWRFTLYALDTMRFGETTPMAAIPIYPTWIFAAAVFAIGVIIQVWMLARLLRQPAEPSEPVSVEPHEPGAP
jgi:TRAP-type C4-dicarboxylate transport system permease small subunit